MSQLSIAALVKSYWLRLLSGRSNSERNHSSYKETFRSLKLLVSFHRIIRLKYIRMYNLQTDVIWIDLIVAVSRTTT
jgi:hypothetical protein